MAFDRLFLTDVSNESFRFNGSFCLLLVRTISRGPGITKDDFSENNIHKTITFILLDVIDSEELDRSLLAHLTDEDFKQSTMTNVCCVIS